MAFNRKDGEKHIIPAGKKRGRSFTSIDKKTFETLCGLQCTESEICSAFDVSINTLCDWCKRTYNGKTFEQVFAEKRQLGFVSLRRKQWRLADKNAQMAQFLGKNYLGQSDTQEVKLAMTTDETAEAMGEYFEKLREKSKADNQAGTTRPDME